MRASFPKGAPFSTAAPLAFQETQTPDRHFSLLGSKGLSTIAKFQKWLEPEGLTLLRGRAQDGLSIEQIAKDLCHVSRSTLHEWMKRFPDISDALKKGGEVPDYAVQNALFEKALNGDVTAMIFWLKNRKPDKWRDRHENAIDLTAGNMGDFEIEVGAPDEQAEN